MLQTSPEASSVGLFYGLQYRAILISNSVRLLRLSVAHMDLNSSPCGASFGFSTRLGKPVRSVLETRQSISISTTCTEIPLNRGFFCHSGAEKPVLLTKKQ